MKRCALGIFVCCSFIAIYSILSNKEYVYEFKEEKKITTNSIPSYIKPLRNMTYINKFYIPILCIL